MSSLYSELVNCSVRTSNLLFLSYFFSLFFFLFFFGIHFTNRRVSSQHLISQRRLLRCLFWSGYCVGLIEGITYCSWILLVKILALLLLLLTIIKDIWNYIFFIKIDFAPLHFIFRFFCERTLITFNIFNIQEGFQSCGEFQIFILEIKHLLA